jgi:glycyl-tRNA synthetase (class II)
MRIEKEIKIKDRKSLKELEAHLEYKRDGLRLQMMGRIDAAKEKWSPVHMAEDFLYRTAVPYVIHTLFGLARSFGDVKEHSKQEEWIELVESLIQAIIQRKASEILHDDPE